ncbi:hypothetical protein BOC39_32080 [Burkholderia pseudomallei]|nr:hypothetical protein BOC39_32080 [Burkholderia pseudomallei]
MLVRANARRAMRAGAARAYAAACAGKLRSARFTCFVPHPVARFVRSEARVLRRPHRWRAHADRRRKHASAGKAKSPPLRAGFLIGFDADLSVLAGAHAAELRLRKKLAWLRG